MGDVSNIVNQEFRLHESQTHVLRTHVAFLGNEIIFGEAETNIPVVFGRNPATKKVLSPGALQIVPAGDMRNFKTEVAPDLLLKTQSIGGGTGQPVRAQTLLFTRGSI